VTETTFSILKACTSVPGEFDGPYCFRTIASLRLLDNDGLEMLES